jgi:hypothetical protein
MNKENANPVRYNNNTSSGHIRQPNKVCQHSQYAEERKEYAWLARLAEWERKMLGASHDPPQRVQGNVKNPPRRVG